MRNAVWVVWCVEGIMGREVERVGDDLGFGTVALHHDERD